MKKIILIILLSISSIGLAQNKTKEQRQAELDARQQEGQTEQIDGNELAREVEPLYITLNLFDKPFSWSGKKVASVNTGNEILRLTGDTGFLFFKSDTHAINYIAAFGWELIIHKTETISTKINTYLFRKLDNGKLPPLK